MAVKNYDKKEIKMKVDNEKFNVIKDSALKHVDAIYERLRSDPMYLEHGMGFEGTVAALFLSRSAAMVLETSKKQSEYIDLIAEMAKDFKAGWEKD